MKLLKVFGSILIASLTLGGCVSGTRAPYDVKTISDWAISGYQSATKLHPIGFSGVRFDSTDPIATAAFRPRVQSIDNNFHVLALSGGGARGSFAAGVLRGWTQSGTRPVFDMVTGVSVGALAAPFAFLGSEFDSNLEAAFTGGEASGLIRRGGSGFRVFFDSSISDSEFLRALTEIYVTPTIISAIAREHRKGRRLLVATTNLDSQRTVVWDMGAIAMKGGPDAQKLFVDVLVASASIPGVLPPVMFDVEDVNRRQFQEMHVDGGVNVPFLAVPEAMQFRTLPEGDRQRGRIWVIVNGRAEPDPSTTKKNTLAILSSSYDSMQRSSTRVMLATTEDFCRRNGIMFSAVTLPREAQAASSSLDFAPESMAQLYAQGVNIGRGLR
jgi:predicted acylesterase/phospholipase RssA